MTIMTTKHILDVKKALDSAIFPTGTPIFIRPTEPEYHPHVRRWKERLFSRPWRPLQKTKQVHDPEAVERNRQIYVINGALYVTREQYDQVKRYTTEGYGSTQLIEVT